MNYQNESLRLCEHFAEKCEFSTDEEIQRFLKAQKRKNPRDMNDAKKDILDAFDAITANPSFTIDVDVLTLRKMLFNELNEVGTLQALIRFKIAALSAA